LRETWFSKIGFPSCTFNAQPAMSKQQSEDKIDRVDTVDLEYFGGYSFLDIHDAMLKDEVFFSLSWRSILVLRLILPVTGENQRLSGSNHGPRAKES
jgi:hypothetical protein